MADMFTRHLLLIMSVLVYYAVTQGTGSLKPFKNTLPGTSPNETMGSIPGNYKTSLVNIYKNVTSTVTQEAAGVTHTVESAAAGAISKQCTVVKETLRLAYEQIKNTKEPNLNALNLEFINRESGVNFNLQSAGTDIVKSKNFDPNNIFTVLIHGFTFDPTKDGYKVIVDAFKKTDNLNVMSLDGSPLINWLYVRSSVYIRFMGEKLGEMLASMTKAGLKPVKIHLVGQGLGAHVAGFTGKTFFNLTKKYIGQITGLDPVGPCFAELNPKMLLQSSDAGFVDVMHTNAGVFGLKDRIGNADFYPNGGYKQPGCLTSICSHKRSWNYYAESVLNPWIFISKKCKNWDDFKNGTCENRLSYMGYIVSKASRGLYYLQTGDKYPYGLEFEGTKFNKKGSTFKGGMG